MLARTILLTLLGNMATAQVNLLTPREAVQIVGMIPEVAQARKQGFCPQFAAGYGDRVDKLGVQVRYGCGPYAGQWVNSYEIDLRTGSTFQLETKEPVKSPEGETLARTLVKQASMRVLSSGEVTCLARMAAKSLTGWDGPGREISVERSDPVGFRFIARLRVQDPQMVTERLLTVDRRTAHVHDDKTGTEVISADLASLASKMLSLHYPSLLSENDALEVAKQIPEVKMQALKPCSVFSVGGPLSWQDIYVSVQSHCEGTPESSVVLVAVSPETGRVTDPNGYRDPWSSSAAETARERLNALDRARKSIRDSVDTACRFQ